MQKNFIRDRIKKQRFEDKKREIIVRLYKQDKLFGRLKGGMVVRLSAMTDDDVIYYYDTDRNFMIYDYIKKDYSMGNFEANIRYDAGFPEHLKLKEILRLKIKIIKREKNAES